MRFKRNKIKKFISLLLVVCMMVSLLPANALALGSESSESEQTTKAEGNMEAATETTSEAEEEKQVTEIETTSEEEEIWEVVQTPDPEQMSETSQEEESEESEKTPTYDNNISGMLWLDMYDNMDNSIYAGDGIHQIEESPLAGYLVYLYKEGDKSIPIQTAVTDVDGKYEFTDIEPGVYIVGAAATTVDGIEYLLPFYYLNAIEGDNRFTATYDENVDAYLYAYTDFIEVDEETAVSHIDCGMRTVPLNQTFGTWTVSGSISDTYTTLSEAITAINADSGMNYTVTGNGDETITAAMLINSNKTVIINGGGATITQTSHGVRHFEVSGSLTLQNIILDGVDTGGGVMISFSTAVFTMETGTVIQNCWANSGGGVYTNNSTFNMLGGKISGNAANANGGGVYINNSTFNMQGGEISDNTANNGGGVFLNNGNSTMGNAAKISSNNANNGGGVYVNNGTFHMQGGEISKNTANTGGGMNAEYTNVIMDSTANISGNHADFGGGVYAYNNTDIDMQGGEISDNTGTIGGGIYMGYASFSMEDRAKISGNVADFGGGVYTNNSTFFDMTGGEISGNTAITGGGIYAEDTTFTMDDTAKISSNGANSGGGVNANNGTIFTMYGGEVSGNTALTGGGVNVNTSTFTMEDTAKINSNDADYGGGVNVNNGIFTMNGGEISSNTANSGGGVYVESNSNFTANAGTIDNNIASLDGGGIYTTNMTSYVNLNLDPSVIFNGNTARVALLPPVDPFTTYPTIQTSSSSVYNHPLNNYDINRIVYTVTVKYLNRNNLPLGTPDIYFVAGGNAFSLTAEEILTITNYVFVDWEDANGTQQNNTTVSISSVTGNISINFIYGNDRGTTEDDLTNPDNISDGIEDILITKEYKTTGGIIIQPSNTIIFNVGGTFSDVAPVLTGYSYNHYELGTTVSAQGAAPSVPVAAGDSDFIILYVYDEVYSLTYDDNGGTGGPGIINNLFDGSYSLSSIVPTYTDNLVTEDAIVFIGWTAVQDTTIYAAGDTAPSTLANITINGANETVYAVWGYDTNGNGTPDVLEPVYDLNYNDNGGIGGPGIINNLVDATYSLSGIVPTHDADMLTGDAIVFIGWIAAQDTTIYGAGDTVPTILANITISGANETVYAVWGYDTNGNGTPDVLEPVYDLNYDDNGGTGGPGTIHNLLDATYSLSGIVPTHAADLVTGDVIVFIGWTATQDATIYEAGDIVPTTISNITINGANETVYAVWGYDRNNNGTPDVFETLYTVTVEYVDRSLNPIGTAITIPSVIQGISYTAVDPGFSGYVLADWSLDGGITLAGNTTPTFTIPANNVTVMLIYGHDSNNDKTEDITVTKEFVDSNGTAIPGSTISTVTVNVGSFYTDIHDIITGYTYVGYKVDGGILQSGEPNIGVNVGDSDRTVSYIYNVNSYQINVKYELRDGTSVPGTTDFSVNQNFGTTYVPTSAQLTIANYVFVGWKINGFVMSGTTPSMVVPASNITMTLVYGQDFGGGSESGGEGQNTKPDGIEDITVIKKFLLADGTSLKPDETVYVNVGSAFVDVHDTMTGYDYTGYKIDSGTLTAAPEEPGFLIGALAIRAFTLTVYKNVTVSYIYKTTQYNIAIEIVDTDGNSIDSGTHNWTVTKEYQESFTVSTPAIEGYIYQFWNLNGIKQSQDVKIASVDGDKVIQLVYQKQEDISTPGPTPTPDKGKGGDSGTGVISGYSKNPAASSTRTPKTGDQNDISIMLFLMMSALCGILLLLAAEKKSRRKRA